MFDFIYLSIYPSSFMMTSLKCTEVTMKTACSFGVLRTSMVPYSELDKYLLITY